MGFGPFCWFLFRGSVCVASKRYFWNPLKCRWLESPEEAGYGKQVDMLLEGKCWWRFWRRFGKYYFAWWIGIKIKCRLFVRVAIRDVECLYIFKYNNILTVHNFYFVCFHDNAILYLDNKYNCWANLMAYSIKLYGGLGMGWFWIWVVN